MNFRPHAWKAIKGLPWPVCTGCGLLRLKNALTDWCVRHGCNHEDHPGYAEAVKRLGRPAA